MDRLWARFFDEKLEEQEQSALYGAPILRIDAQGDVLAHILCYLEDYERWLFGSTCKFVRNVVQTHPAVWTEITDLFAALNIYCVIVDTPSVTSVQASRRTAGVVYETHLPDSLIVDAHNFSRLIKRINTSETRMLRLNPKICLKHQRPRYVGPQKYYYEQRFDIDRVLLRLIQVAFPRLEVFDMRAAITYFGLKPTSGAKFQDLVRMDGAWLFPRCLKTLIYNGRNLESHERVYFTSMGIEARMRDRPPLCERNKMDCYCCGRYVPCACQIEGYKDPADKSTTVECFQPTCAKCNNVVCTRCQRTYVGNHNRRPKFLVGIVIPLKLYCRRCVYTYPCEKCGRYYHRGARIEMHGGGVEYRCTDCLKRDCAPGLTPLHKTFFESLYQ